MKWLLILGCLMLPTQQQAMVIKQQVKVPASSSFEYEFVDLGETDLPMERLSKNALPHSDAPQINDNRQVVCNQKAYGEIRGVTPVSIIPQISSMRSHCYGINNTGDLLLAFERSPTDLHWWLWSQKEFKKTSAQQIDCGDILGRNLYFRAINDAKQAIGVFKPAGQLRPVIWTPEEGLHHLGYYLGWDIEGVLWGINQSGSVVGHIEADDRKSPFLWSKKWGLDRLNRFAWRWQELVRCPVEGEIQFADLLVSEDGRLYGTFWICSADTDEEELPTALHAFWWDPRSDSLRALNLDNMRINAISLSETLVGAWHGQAALCDPGCLPIAVSDLLPNKDPSWQLLEATDINIHGDIVGYGRRDEKLHYFMVRKCGHKLN